MLEINTVIHHASVSLTNLSSLWLQQSVIPRQKARSRSTKRHYHQLANKMWLYYGTWRKGRGCCYQLMEGR